MKSKDLTSKEPNIDCLSNTNALDENVQLKVEKLSKKFCRNLRQSLFYGMQDICGELIGSECRDKKLRKGEFWALKDISFQIRRGESLGLIGANGSGKTTLLRIISGLIKPDIGKVIVKGKLAPLLAAGVGFNPILSGRENIYINMSILGLSNTEIEKQFDSVVDFSEIGDAIDAPVQTYSSGMLTRLGFSCAIHAQNDILLLDEVLAVGDMRFRTKCYRRLAQLREEGTSFVLVSHNPHAILSICDKALYLSKGRFMGYGKTDKLMQEYESDLYQTRKKTSRKNLSIQARFSPERDLLIESFSFRNSLNQKIDTLVTGQRVDFCLKCKSSKIEIENLNVAVTVREISNDMEMALSISNKIDEINLKNTSYSFTVILNMPSLGLKPGIYDMKICLAKENFAVFDAIESFQFKVVSPNAMSYNRYYQPRNWKIKNHSTNVMF